MKLNKANHKVAVFSIAALALTASAGVTINNLVLNRNSGNVNHSVFAAEAKQISAKGSTASITVKEEYGTSVTLGTTTKIKVDDSSTINAGDYVEVSFDNITQSGLSNGMTLTSSDGKTVIGTLQQVSAVPFSGKVEGSLQNYMNKSNQAAIEALDPTELIGWDTTWRIVFNDKAKDIADLEVDLNIDNSISHTAYRDRPTEYTHTISINGDTKASTTSTTTGVPKLTDVTTRAWYSRMQIEYSNGNLVGGYIDYSFINGTNNPLRAGDVVEIELSGDSGVAFDTAKIAQPGTIATTETRNQELWLNTDGTVAGNGLLMKTGTQLKYEVLESSPTKLRYKIVEVGDALSRYQWLPNITLLDESDKTIDRANMKLNEITATTKIVRNGQTIAETERSRGGDIVGASVGGSGQYVAKGSVIRRIVSQSGQKISGYESDQLVKERSPVGESYSVDAPEIPNYTFVGVAEDSAAQNGSIIEGVQTVTLVYKITAQDIEINIGDTPDPKDHIPDFDEKLPGCEVRYKEELDTSKAGTIDATIIISCPDKEDEGVDVKVIVKPAPEDEETPAPQLEAPKTEPKKEIEAPHTGFEKARSVALATFASLSTFAVLGTAIFKRR